jgi:DNA-binding XRE family transcriptional regulator
MRKYSRSPKFISKKMKQLRNKKSLTQEELAEIIGVSVNYIGYIDQNKRTPSIKTADKIARALGVKFADLFN